MSAERRRVCPMRRRSAHNAVGRVVRGRPLNGASPVSAKLERGARKKKGTSNAVNGQ